MEPTERAGSSSNALQGVTTGGHPRQVDQSKPHHSDWRSQLEHYKAATKADDSPENWEGLGEAAWWLQETVILFAARLNAYRLYRRTNDTLGAARIAICIGNDHFDFRGEAAVANGWLLRARRLLEGHEPCALHAWLAIWEARLALMARNDTSQARSLVRAGLALARRVGCADIEPLALALEGLSLVNEGAAREGMAQLDEASAAALGGEAEDPLAVGLTCCYVIGGCEQVRDFDRAAQWCERLREFCELHDFSSLLTNCRLQYGSVLTFQGRWDQAEEQLLAAVNDMKTWRPSLLPGAHARLGELRRRQGRCTEARELFEQAGNHPTALLGSAWLDYESGDLTFANDRVQLLLRRIPAAASLQRVPVLELLVRLELASGHPDLAHEALRDLEAAKESLDVPAIRAAVLRARGAVAVREGQSELVIACLEDAADLYRGCRMLFETAACELELASQLLRFGRATAALRAARSSAHTFGLLGAPRVQEEAQRLVASMSRERRQVDDRAGQVLSARECEVLRLVAQGLGDRQIAESLGLSKYTVHRHLSNIRLKLEVPSRSAAVARALALGII